jgi:hypothetical protein
MWGCSDAIPRSILGGELRYEFTHVNVNFASQSSMHNINVKLTGFFPGQAAVRFEQVIVSWPHILCAQLHISHHFHQVLTNVSGSSS